MSELGLFPLGIVLLPTEQIPLHIFEDRYQELIGECLAEEREFGLVFADDDGLREIGTRAAVTEVLDQFEDGRLNIVVEGRERFRLVELTEGRSFQTGLVEPVEDEPDPADPDDTEQARRALPPPRRADRRRGRGAEPRLRPALLRARRPLRVRAGAEAAAAAAHLGARADEACSPSSSPARRPPVEREREIAERAQGNGKVDPPPLRPHVPWAAWP